MRACKCNPRVLSSSKEWTWYHLLLTSKLLIYNKFNKQRSSNQSHRINPNINSKHLRCSSSSSNSIECKAWIQICNLSPRLSHLTNNICKYRTKILNINTPNSISNNMAINPIWCIMLTGRCSKLTCKAWTLKITNESNKIYKSN